MDHPFSQMAAEALPETSVKLILMGELRRWAGGREFHFTLPAGSTVQTLTERLMATAESEFTNRFTIHGRLQSQVAVFVNGQDIRQLADMDTILPDGQIEMMLLHQIEGGTS